MNFILQKTGIPFDFQLLILNAKEYYKWQGEGKQDEQKTQINILWSDEYERVSNLMSKKEWCPIGSIEFVLSWLRDCGVSEIQKPINVPEQLFPYQKRKIINGIGEEKVPGDKVFRKHLHKFKDTRSGIVDSPWNTDFNSPSFFQWHDGDHRYIQEDYQISELIDIESEWRVFVEKGNILDIKNYNGSCFNLPDYDFIKKMVEVYKTNCPSYTIDFAKCSDGSTQVVEVHEIFSCGLYGYSDYAKYPFLMWRWFKWKL